VHATKLMSCLFARYEEIWFEISILIVIVIIISWMLNLYSERFASITRGYPFTVILERLLVQLPASCRSLSSSLPRLSSGRFVFCQSATAVSRTDNYLTSSLLLAVIVRILTSKLYLIYEVCVLKFCNLKIMCDALCNCFNRIWLNTLTTWLNTERF